MAEKTGEEIALERIEEGIKTGETEFDLSNLGLTYFPVKVLQLPQTRALNLAGNLLVTLPPEISMLTRLEELILSENNLENIPPKIGDLVNLKKLDLSSNRLRSLPSEIGKLKNLSTLLLGMTSKQEEIKNEELGRFLSYEYLIEKLNSKLGDTEYLEYRTGMLNAEENLNKTVSQNNIFKELPPSLKELKSLKELSINSVQLEVLPSFIGNFTELIHLRANQNEIKRIPEEILELKNLEKLYLYGNPIPVPTEILYKWNEPQTILNYYFSALHWGTEPINELKLLIIGQGSVGKTSLVQKILHGTFNQGQIKTEGISINKWKIDDIKFNIWDFGGQEIMHATHQFFLTKRSLYLLVLDSRLTQEENRAEYWLKIVQSFGGNSPVIVVGNKIDQHPLDIDRTGLKKKFRNIVGILETSAATGKGVEELKATIAAQINKLRHVRDLLPKNWFTVKTKLEELGKQSNFITHDKYLELCAENEVSDETSQRTLIGFLHDLGVVLHFQDDPRLEALGILNPQWVTNGVYKILNSHTLFQNKGVLTTSMLDEILNLPEYPRGKRLFIVDMMKKFELCYDIEADKTFLVPDLLPKDQPDLKFNGIPAFEYAYPVLPSSVITRFIVRMNQKIDDGFVWRTGVVLKIGENKALVKADIEDRKITISIDGLEHTRRDALSAIRYELGEIHNSIKGLNPQQRVPIPDAPNAEPLDYDYLLQLERDGFEEHPVKNGNRLVKVNVRKLLSGVVSESERRQTGGNITNIFISGDVKDSNIIAGDENETSR